jgi:hypothetical protein
LFNPAAGRYFGRFLNGKWPLVYQVGSANETAPRPALAGSGPAPQSDFPAA